MDVANFGLRIAIARVHLAQTNGRFSVRFSGELTGKNPNYINARGPGSLRELLEMSYGKMLQK